jgi:hypothetical protein
MTKELAPQLQFVAKDKYCCVDLPALHRWLEAHGYRYYGHHAPNEYGRFACQETHDCDDGRTYVHSYIQVLATGELFAPGPHARDLLAPLVVDQERERTV